MQDPFSKISDAWLEVARLMSDLADLETSGRDVLQNARAVKAWSILADMTKDLIDIAVEFQSGDVRDVLRYQVIPAHRCALSVFHPDRRERTVDPAELHILADTFLGVFERMPILPDEEEVAQ